MKRWSVIIAAVVVVAAGLLARPGHEAAAQGNGWITLFDGETLSNWDLIGTANWRLEGGAAVADSGNGFLVSKNDYGDFQLRVEFWIEAKTNSGVFIRCTDPNVVNGKNAYEVNIFDTRPDPKYATGAIVDVASSSQVIKAGGKWNLFEITAKGPRFDVTLNGIKSVVSANDSRHPKGRIALQYGSGVVKFRKVEIKTM